MSIQSNVQQLLQNVEGLQTTAQSGVPSGVNNGNPNSVYNWSSYIPSILRNSQGTPTGANFDLITSQPTASSPGTGWNTGYTPPFTADPFAAMLMSQLSQYRGPSASSLPGYGAGNPMVDNILRNLIGNYVATPRPGTTTPPTGGGTTPPTGGGTTPPTGGGTVTPQPGTGVSPQPGAGVVPNAGSGNPVQWSDYNASPIVGGGGPVGGVNAGTGGSTGIGGNTGGNLPSGTYTPNYGNFDNTGTVGPIWGNNPYGSNFSTGTGTGAPANQGGGWRGALSGAWNGLREALAPANASQGGALSDFAATMALRAGYNTQTNNINLMDAGATLAGGPAALAPGMIYDAGTGVVGGAMAGWRGGSPSLDGAAGTANNPAQGFGFGEVAGNWNAADVYTPSEIVNPDFSLGNTPTSNVGDINAYLDNMRAGEAPGGFTGGGSTGYGQLSGGNSYDMGSAELAVSPQLQAYLNSLTAEQLANVTEADVRANGGGATPTAGPAANVQNIANRTPEQEAQYAAQLTMQSNLAAQRYGSDINMGNLPAATREK